MLWMRVTSSASSRCSGGSNAGRRRASIVLPLPGGPSSSRLCPPAAAISSARNGSSCPRTSARSSSSAGRFASAGAGADGGAGGTSPPSSSVADLAQGRDRQRSRSPRPGPPPPPARARRRARRDLRGVRPRRPRARPGRRVPRRSATARRRRPSGRAASAEHCPLAASRPTASAASKPGPTLRRCAGARFAVMRRAGNSKPELRIAACTRSRASRTAASASPTTRKVGSPGRMSTSTHTGRGSMPVDGERGDAGEHERHARWRSVTRLAHFATISHMLALVAKRLQIGANRARRDVARRPSLRHVSDDLRHRLGRVGEQLAAEHLERRGFEILARNHRTRWGEIDLIAADDAADRLLRGQDTARRRSRGPFDGLREAQCRRLRRMAAAWLQAAAQTAHARPSCASTRSA